MPYYNRDTKRDHDFDNHPHIYKGNVRNLQGGSPSGCVGNLFEKLPHLGFTDVEVLGVLG